ncbi:DUF2442 domain-containing protein [Agrobacterium sp. BA1120]|uniref:DUF2442 domain-containing protein n=1 Tax=Agrobacterium sp. BA1120 TaxID=3228927 RepID=UPI00336AC774
MTKKPPGKTHTTASDTGDKHSAYLSFGSGLDDIGVKPLGRRITVKPGRDVGGSPSPYHVARTVEFETASGMIIVELEHGPTLLVPARRLNGLMQATDSEIADVELMERTSLFWRKLGVTLKIKALLSGKSSAHSVMILKRPARFKWANDLATSSEWPALVVKFLSSNLPGSRASGWYHDFLTAYQIGCETLVALGQAIDTSTGAQAVEKPRFPELLPRPDDVAVAVIYLATQNGLITFPSSRKSAHSQTSPSGHDFIPFSEGGAWIAHVHPQVVVVLRSLGMLEGDKWTGSAETIWWREDPSEWRLHFERDARFEAAVKNACERIPDHIKDAMRGILEISNDDIAIHRSPDTNYASDDIATTALYPPETHDEVIQRIRYIRSKDFDCLFYKYWRLNDGWLSNEDAGRALDIFNDPLAISMRKAVVRRLFPDSPELAR